MPNSKEPGRFADTGVDTLIQRVTEAGAVTRRLVVKLAGGASVLGPANAEKFKIGERNAEAIKERLKGHGLSAAAVDGRWGARSHPGGPPASGKTFVRTAASPANEL